VALTPLVLAGQVDSYEVVDGQQRLTTLLLILRHFNDRASKKYQQTVYKIVYATRPDLHAFLENPSDELAEKYIDYSHIAKAIKVIDAWFEERDSEVEAIKDTFLNKVKLIWFQLGVGENPVAAFTRLNVGKIPLTNGELIRALLLRSAKGSVNEARRLRIAYEWDLVEKSLQDPALWSFLHCKTGSTGSRIDFLFALAAKQQGMKQGTDDYQTFNHFSQKLADRDADPAETWLEVKKIHMQLVEWFEDRRLYHLVGFLTWADVDINELRNLAKGSRKSDLKVKLRTKIVEHTFGASAPDDSDEMRGWISEQLDEVAYPRNPKRIRSILLLFNLATLLIQPQSNIRFHFESFKTGLWDIEHVRSIASEQPESSASQLSWLSKTMAYLDIATQDSASAELKEKIQAHQALPPKERVAAFEPLYAELLKYFHEDASEGPDNSIANLVLLDQETNRSYQNAVFSVKRLRVLQLDQNGTFVPHCTRNVFLKCYSPQVDHTMYWTHQDREGYRKALVDTLHTFITGEWIDV